jgi:WD40 repeat protein
MLLASAANDEIKIEDLRSSGQLALIRLDAVATAIDFEPGGRLVVGDQNGALKVFDAKGAAVASVAGSGAPISRLAFDRDGRRVATGDTEGRVVVRDLGDPGLKAIVDAVDHIGTVGALAVSADGTQVASGGIDCAVVLRKIDGGGPARTLARHTYHVTGVAFRYDGKVLASADGLGEVMVWDTTSGELRRSLLSNDQAIQLLDFTPGGESLRAISGTGGILDWSTNDWKLAVRYVGGGEAPESGDDEGGMFYDTIAASADGSRVALIASSVLSVEDLGAQSSKTMATGLPWVQELRFAGDDLISLGGGDNGGIIAWSLGGAGPRFLTNHAPEIAVTPDGDAVVIQTNDYDDNTAKSTPQLEEIPLDAGAHAAEPFKLPSAGLLGPRGGLISVVLDKEPGKGDKNDKGEKDKNNEKPRGTTSYKAPLQQEKQKTTRGGELTYTPYRDTPITRRGVMGGLNADETRLAVITTGDDDDGYDLVVYQANGDVIGTVHHVADVTPDFVAVDPEGRYVAISAAKSLQLFDVSAPDAPPIAVPVDTGAVELGPEGRVALIDRKDPKDQRLVLGKIAKGKLVSGADPQLHHVTAVELSPDGKLVAVGGEDGTISLVSIDDGKLVATLLGDGSRWVAYAGDRIDGSSGEDDPNARGADLVVWRVGDLQLPGQSAWDRQLHSGLLGEVMRPFGFKAATVVAPSSQPAKEKDPELDDTSF